MNREHVVYTVRDAKGRVLYVGMTKNFPHRIAMHRSQSRWFPAKPKIEITEKLTRQDAFLYERRLIWELQPPHNQTHSRGYLCPPHLVPLPTALTMLGLQNHQSWGRQILAGYGAGIVYEQPPVAPFYLYDDIERIAREIGVGMTIQERRRAAA